MIPQKITLWDSVSLRVINTDKFKAGMVFFSFTVPKRKEFTADRLMLPGVLRRGTVEYPCASTLNLALDELYASAVEIKISHIGKNDLITFSAEMLDNAFVTDGTDVFDGVVHIISQMLLHPLTDGKAFPKDTVNKERANVMDAIKAEINNPKTYTAARCAELLHSEDSDFIPINELLEAVSKTDANSVYRAYRDLLESSKLDIFYIGSLTPEHVTETIKKNLSHFTPNICDTVSVYAEKFTKEKELTELFPVSQSKLALGFRVGVCTTDKQYYAAILFNELFGGSPASKLFMNVRERLGLCYYCSSHYDSYFGNLTVSSGIDAANVDSAKAEILAQLEAIKKGEISNAEIHAAKKAFEHYCRQMYDYPSELFTFYRSRAIIGVDITPEEHIRHISDVTLEDVIELARGIKLDTVFLLEGTLTPDNEQEVYDD